MTRLQFAMDGAAKRTIEDALKIISEVKDSVDIIECGTSFVLKYGMLAVKSFKEQFPDKTILADMKIMDGGYHNCKLATDVNADIITVLGVSDKETIANATKAAHDAHKEIMVDFICVNNVAEMVDFCESINADYLCVHTGTDAQAQGRSPYEPLKEMIALTRKCKVAVAGGVNMDTIEEICALHPDVVIVGGAIHKDADPKEAARRMKAKIAG